MAKREILSHLIEENSWNLFSTSRSLKISSWFHENFEENVKTLEFYCHFSNSLVKSKLLPQKDDIVSWRNWASMYNYQSNLIIEYIRNSTWFALCSYFILQKISIFILIRKNWDLHCVRWRQRLASAGVLILILSLSTKQQKQNRNSKKDFIQL